MAVQPSRRLLLQSVAAGGAGLAVAGAAPTADAQPLRPGAIRAEDIQAAHVATLAVEFCRTLSTPELTGLRAAA